MSASLSSQLHLSLNHDALAQILTDTENVLIIQDLDGVCMGLVKDPLRRVIALEYVEATQAFDGHFYVLTNGEHIGKRGVNGIIERAVGNKALVQEKGLYLPGLAAGGVQWQDRYGNVSHPGVSEQELAFLETVSQRFSETIRSFFKTHSGILEGQALEDCISASILDNIASPTANLNTAYEKLSSHLDLYIALQQQMQTLIRQLFSKAAEQGMKNSFFVHYAPNLGRDAQGKEILRPATERDSGTTDFQFMLRGAVKEAGVLMLLNHYYFQRMGNYPLGQDFNARQAPSEHSALLELVQTHFDAAQMPILIGVGDTVNSQVEEKDGETIIRRGGSDRNFLQLIQDIGEAFQKENLVVYVDSSQGEVKNRKQLKLGLDNNQPIVLEGPGDSRDKHDPLKINIAFPGGHSQYAAFFQEAAHNRGKR